MRACLVALLLVVPSMALAQDPIVLETTHITGTPPGPHVTVLLPRHAPRFRRAEPDHHAVDRIVESVRHDPF